jgi:hypothetical protein
MRLTVFRASSSQTRGAAHHPVSRQVGTATLGLLESSRLTGFNLLPTMTGRCRFVLPAHEATLSSCSGSPAFIKECESTAGNDIGARFDPQPELLFTLRGVDSADLINSIGANLSGPGAARRPARCSATGSWATFSVSISTRNSLSMCTWFGANARARNPRRRKPLRPRQLHRSRPRT